MSKDSLSVSQQLVVRGEDPYQLDQEPRAAINRLLADSVAWRIALDSDNSRELLTEIKKERPTYHPYYSRSDIDMDGKTDFAIAIVRDSTIAVFWFSKKDSGYSEARSVAQADWFDECGFALDPRQGQLSFGHFYSDVGVFFEWDSVRNDLVLSPETEEVTSSE